MKVFGSRIYQWFTRHIFITAADQDQFFFQQFLDTVIAVHPADRFYFAFGDRLFVGNDGQCFQRCIG
jgi:hypothetical protein